LVLRFPNRRAWLFDCGGEKRIVESFLSSQVDRIEHVFLTHTHHDHVCNLRWICRRWPIETVWLPAVTPNIPKECARELIRAKEEKKLAKVRVAVVDNGVEPVRRLGERAGTPGDPDVVAELLYPTALDSLLGQSGLGGLDGLRGGANVFSCVYRIVYGENRILLPGDADMSALQRLAKSDPGRLKCKMLIAPHHGKPQNVAQKGLSFADLAVEFDSDVAFVSNSATAKEEKNWPPDDNFIRAMAKQGTKVVCAELTPTCQCKGAVRGPVGRAPSLGLPDNGRYARACIGTLRIELEAGEVKFPDVNQHADKVAENPHLAKSAPCIVHE